MRLQLVVPAADVGLHVPISRVDADGLTDRMALLLTDQGFVVTRSEDHADVVPEMADWSLLTPEERSSGGFVYPELLVAGVAGIAIDIFKREVFFSSEPARASEQDAAAQVVRALRALAPMLPVPAQQWTEIEREAARVQVAADGSIQRSVMDAGELRSRAIALFDEVWSAERERPWAARYEADLRGLADDAAGLPPFYAAVAAAPEGGAYGIELPDADASSAASFDRLQERMIAIVDDALREADPASGLPTGLAVEHDDAGTRARLVFDNLVDGGAAVPGARAESYREAPFAWESITIEAARRDPAFQPTWLEDAVALVRAGGTDVVITRS